MSKLFFEFPESEWLYDSCSYYSPSDICIVWTRTSFYGEIAFVEWKLMTLVPWSLMWEVVGDEKRNFRFPLAIAVATDCCQSKDGFIWKILSHPYSFLRILIFVSRRSIRQTEFWCLTGKGGGTREKRRKVWDVGERKRSVNLEGGRFPPI